MLGKLLGVSFSTADMRLLKSLLQQGLTPWTNFTPGVSQGGALTVTVSYAAYAIVGKIAHVQMLVLVDSAGTAGNAITVTGIPAAIQPRRTGDRAVCGWGVYNRFGTANYSVAAVANSPSTLTLFGGDGTSFLGINPSFAASASDELGLVLVYEIA